MITALTVIWTVIHVGGISYVIAEFGDMISRTKLIPQPNEPSLAELERWYETAYPNDYLDDQLRIAGAYKPPISTEGPRAGQQIRAYVAKLRGRVSESGSYKTVSKNGKIYRYYEDGRVLLVGDSPVGSSYTGPYRYPNS